MLVGAYPKVVICSVAANRCCSWGIVQGELDGLASTVPCLMFLVFRELRTFFLPAQFMHRRNPRPPGPDQITPSRIPAPFDYYAVVFH